MSQVEPHEDVVTRLLHAGYDPTMLSATLDIPIEEILALIPPERRSVAAADAQLQMLMRALAFRAIEESMMILDEGTVPLKMKVIQKTLGDLGKAIMVSDKDEMADLRDAFREMTEEIRHK